MTNPQVPTSSPPPNRRLLALDALRLIASLVVFVHHFDLMFDCSLPLYLKVGLFDAKGAVTFFFVLSGYVLALSLSRDAPSAANYVKFGIRRVFRLYPLYWTALLFTFAVLVSIRSTGGFLMPPDIPAEFLAGQGMQWNQWFLQATLVAPGMQSFFANPPVWTLMTEAKIAILFPFLAWGLLRAYWQVVCVVLAALVLGSNWLYYHVVGTAAVLGQFSIGVLLFRLPPGVWQCLSKWAWGVVGIVSMLLYCSISLRHMMPIWLTFYMCAFGGAGMIACACHMAVIREPLSRLQSLLKVDISYAVYILHYPVLIGLRQLVHHGELPNTPPGLFIIAVVLTGGLSLALHFIIEKPAIRLGRRLSTGTFQNFHSQQFTKFDP